MSVRSCMDKMIVTRTHKTRGSTKSCVRWARVCHPVLPPTQGVFYSGCDSNTLRSNIFFNQTASYSEAYSGSMFTHTTSANS